MSLSTTVAMVGVPLYVLGSLVSGYLAILLEQQDEPTEIRLTFVGDMMFDRYVREQATQHGYDSILADMAPSLKQSIAIIGNLEGPITTFTPVADYRDQGPDHYKFTFATRTATELASAGFGAVSLSNNHIQNFGTDGITQTKEWLTAEGVGYFGGPADSYRPWRLSTGGLDIAVYAYDMWYAHDVRELAVQVSQEESAFVIVYAHWGEEYDSTPNAAEREIAHALIDVGADLIVGSHPHVVQHKEIYKDRLIYYSLGNFVFDQYFSPAVRCGAVIHVVLRDDQTYTVEETFAELASDGTTEPSDCMKEVTLQNIEPVQ